MSINNQLKVIFRVFFINSFAASYCMPKRIRKTIYKFYGMKVESTNVCPHCFFGSNKIDIGKNTFVNYNCFFEGSDFIKIGDNCNIAMGCKFITSSHDIGSSDHRAEKNITKDICIGEGSWIGANAIILPGVKIGKGCIIAAGAVVTEDCEADYMYAGSPAVKKKKLD